MYVLSNPKFDQTGAFSRILDLTSGEELIRLPMSLDTQDFICIDDYVVVIHHQFYREQNFFPVEIYNLGTKKRLGVVDNGNVIQFPTSLAYDGKKLVVACNGRDFNGEICTFSQNGAGSFELLSRYPLGEKCRRPSCLAIDGEIAFFGSYSGQSIWQLNFISGELTEVLDISKFGQTTPMGIKVTKDRLFVLGHVDGSLAIYDRKYLLPSKIIRSDLRLPWSLVVNEDSVFVSNIGKLHKSMQPGYIIELDYDGFKLDMKRVQGPTVLRNSNP